MAMSVGTGSSDEHDEVMSTINTTPLVDVMLVLLIIFLITIPVVSHTVPVTLPKEAVHPLQTTPQNVILAVTKDGDVFWNEGRVPDTQALVDRLKTVAVQTPQPEVHIRGDLDARYAAIGRVVLACQRAGIAKVDFITEAPPRQ
ncbi:biopolymer transporter ExbD [Ralstonia insidiosa]|jgi:biopolymer transport protein ExbD|uniref:Biopolymer transporter ExbD n=1 Tax=Ralstonia insidiosa TaxID=190721 RepID=A0A191ZTV0_9RALS|nr:biopolymer transporter ExbD [Ralstonia insidiosa]ANJ71524.1 biopolymer transporter ExbD [Ralstonia insidiosa]KAB0472123.1 biopolymer transporter ExbD [Ralstonia insidiosa]MBY4908300.1 biopolymer transporter ExbD [Ralstonia insidiosa]